MGDGERRTPKSAHGPSGRFPGALPGTAGAGGDAHGSPWGGPSVWPARAETAMRHISTYRPFWERARGSVGGGRLTEAPRAGCGAVCGRPGRSEGLAQAPEHPRGAARRCAPFTCPPWPDRYRALMATPTEHADGRLREGVPGLVRVPPNGRTCRTPRRNVPPAPPSAGHRRRNRARAPKKAYTPKPQKLAIAL